MAEPEVSVVVSTYGRAARLPRLVAALEAQTLDRARFEVVIADDASPDDTPQVLERLRRDTPVDLQVVHAQVNRGPAAGRNLAMGLARGPILAFTDDDCVPDPGWLTGLLDRFAPGVDVVQGRTLPAEPVTARLPATLHIEAFTQLYETANIAYRAEALRAVGGFDETFRHPFAEDTAAGWAVRRLGGDAVFADDALVLHDVTYPGLAWHLRRARRYGAFNTLVRSFPEMREELLFARYFLRPRNAMFAAAVVGAGLALRRPMLAGLAAPYLWRARPSQPTLDSLTDSAIKVAYDAAVLSALVAGSVKERTLVL